MPTIGEQLATDRAKTKFSLTNAAKRAGLSAMALSKIESGKTSKPRIATLACLANLYGSDLIQYISLAGHVETDPSSRAALQALEALGQKTFNPEDLRLLSFFVKLARRVEREEIRITLRRNGEIFLTSKSEGLTDIPQWMLAAIFMIFTDLHPQ